MPLVKACPALTLKIPSHTCSARVMQRPGSPTPAEGVLAPLVLWCLQDAWCLWWCKHTSGSDPIKKITAPFFYTPVAAMLNGRHGSTKFPSFDCVFSCRKVGLPCNCRIGRAFVASARICNFPWGPFFRYPCKQTQPECSGE